MAAVLGIVGDLGETRTRRVVQVDLTALVRRSGGSGTDLTLDVTLWDADSLPAGRLEDVRLRAAALEAMVDGIPTSGVRVALLAA